MYDGYFIAGISDLDGENQTTYHCKNEYWDMFVCTELETAPPYDGHTPDEALQRIYRNSCPRL